MTANSFEGSERPEQNRIPPLGLGGSAALFGAGALLLFLTTRIVIHAGFGAMGFLVLAFGLA